MFRGNVVSLHIARDAALPMEALPVAKAVAGQGLEGDRYFNGTGHWSKHPGVSREVTLIEIEAIEALERGGITDVAKGLWMRHADIRVTKLLDYAKRLHVGSIYRRLRYLLELFSIATDAELHSLRNSLTATNVPLDPSFPTEGPHLAKWRLQLNIPAEELLAVQST